MKNANAQTLKRSNAQNIKIELVQTAMMALQAIANLEQFEAEQVAKNSVKQKPKAFISGSVTGIGDKVDMRGFHPRNGRCALLREVFAEKGLDANTDDLLAIANARGVARGLIPLSKSSFSSMLSEAKAIEAKEQRQTA